MNGVSTVLTLGLVCIMATVPIAMGIRQKERLRRFQHTERLRALEMGIPLPGDRAWPAVVCIALGAVVPLGALGVALTATLSAPHWAHSGASMAILWGGAAAIGVSGVRAGAGLAHRLFDREYSQIPVMPAGKPAAFDPDAYDTVSRRG